MPTMITVSAVCLLDDRGRILLVRKRGTSMFMQPGGKPEAGESPVQTAIREVREELGLELRAADLAGTGEWTGPAANEPGTLLHAHLFAARLAGVPRVASELEEMCWEFPHEALVRGDIAPLLREHVLPGLLGGHQDSANCVS